MAKVSLFYSCLLVTSVLLVTACTGDGRGPKSTSELPESSEAHETETPASLSESTPTRAPVPTPNQPGHYEDLTVEQAQAMMPFEVIVPSEDEAPPSFELSEITADAEVLQTGFGDSVAIQFWFAPLDGAPGDVIQVSQRAGTVLVGSDGERSQLEINGEEVTRVILPERDNGQRMVAYNWKSDEYSVSVSGMTGASNETDDFEELIRWILEN